MINDQHAKHTFQTDYDITIRRTDKPTVKCVLRSQLVMFLFIFVFAGSANKEHVTLTLMLTDKQHIVGRERPLTF